MAPLSTDLCKKVSRKWTGQVGSGGISDAVVTSFNMTTTNLPTDTGVVLVVDRVDSAGVATPSKEETIIGINSTGSITSCTRGVEGTAQAHNAGAVVEVLMTAKGWNDVVDAFLVEHTQLGAHGATILKTTGSYTISGSDTFTGALVAGSGILKAINNTSGSGVSTFPTSTGTLATLALTETLTNKRITPRVVTATDDATAVIDCDITDQYQLTAVANATEFTVTGTPTAGQKLIIRVKDAGVSKNLTFTGFTAIGCTIPTATTAGKTTYVGAIYDATTPTWSVVAVATQA